MNSTSFLLCIVFAAIGYILHPMLLPKLLESKVVAESALSDTYMKDKAEKEKPRLSASQEADLGGKIPREAPKSSENKSDTKLGKSDPVMPIPTPEPTPEPTPDSEPIVEEKLSAAEFINALQSSVKSGDVNEFTFDQVTEWNRLGEQPINGDIYDVGLVTYSAKTIFGDQELQAKALIKDGKVVEWLWATTNTIMR